MAAEGISADDSRQNGFFEAGPQEYRGTCLVRSICRQVSVYPVDTEIDDLEKR